MDFKKLIFGNHKHISALQELEEEEDRKHNGKKFSVTIDYEVVERSIDHKTIEVSAFDEEEAETLAIEQFETEMEDVEEYEIMETEVEEKEEVEIPDTSTLEMFPNEVTKVEK